MTYRPSPPPRIVRLPADPYDSGPDDTIARLRKVGRYALRDTPDSGPSAIEREADRVRESYS